MKTKSFTSRRWRVFPISQRVQCSVLCLIALATVGLLPSRAFAAEPLQLAIVYPEQHERIVRPGSIVGIRYGVTNYVNPFAPIGTITDMDIYVDGNPLPTTIDNPSSSGYALWNTSGQPNPSPHWVYATVTVVTPENQVYSWASTAPPPPYPVPPDPPLAGEGHAIDLFVAFFGIDRLQYDNDFPMYDRANQWDILKPQMHRHWVQLPGGGEDVVTDWDYPAGYVKGTIPTVKFGLDVPSMNNVTARYNFHLWFANENYSFDALNQSLQGGLNNSQTCPALPDYIYAHHFRIRIYIWFWAPNEQRWVPYQSWGIPSDPEAPALDWGGEANYWYAVFSDPNFTFPRYKWGGTGAFQTKPWYQVIENALNHATNRGTDQTVTTVETALQNLTTDLYIWPSESPPGSSLYAPGGPVYYLPYPLPPETPSEVVFDLWGMTQATTGDCQDFSSYLQCQARSIGIRGMTSKHLGIPNQPSDDFICHPLLFCGKSSWRFNVGFDFHQLVWRTGTARLYDWAFAFQHSSPPGWRLCIEYTESDEISALVWIGSPTFGGPFALGNDIDPLGLTQAPF